MKLLLDATIATMCDDSPYGLIEGGALVVDGEKIAWVGPLADLPERYAQSETVSFEGCLITPALIDCHTHLVFGGDRAKEFEMRLEGASYEEIARAGGGIVSTVGATREASEEKLLDDALARVDALIAEGVATIEIKSGYGLDRETELKCSASPVLSRRIGQSASRPVFSAPMRCPRGRSLTPISMSCAFQRCGRPIPKGWSMR